jgi:hypothetical protein
MSGDFDEMGSARLAGDNRSLAFASTFFGSFLYQFYVARKPRLLTWHILFTFLGTSSH